MQGFILMRQTACTCNCTETVKTDARMDQQKPPFLWKVSLTRISVHISCRTNSGMHDESIDESEYMETHVRLLPISSPGTVFIAYSDYRENSSLVLS